MIYFHSWLTKYVDVQISRCIYIYIYIFCWEYYLPIRYWLNGFTINYDCCNTTDLLVFSVNIALKFKLFSLSVEIIWMLLPQGDHAALLSAFSEMGLKLRLDMPEQAMEVTTVFFRTSTSAKESLVSMH